MTKIELTWWKDKGFAEFPRFISAVGGEKLYRAYGTMQQTGEGSKLYGSCYTFKKPDSVSSAERDMNVVKWGNRLRFVATFEVRKGTPLFIGKIDQSYGKPGDGFGDDMSFDCNINAEQVYIERSIAEACLIHIPPSKVLYQDVSVIIPNKEIWV